MEQRYGRVESPREDNSSTRVGSNTPTPHSQAARDAEPGPARGRSLERRTPNNGMKGATLMRSPTPSARDDGVQAGSGVPTESDRQVATRSRWQAMLLEAGGIGAALSDESMKRLKYCLQWLQVSMLPPLCWGIQSDNM